MKVCIPDTSAFMAISLSETCCDSFHQEIQQSEIRVLLSLVHTEFRAIIAKRFNEIFNVCDFVIERGYSKNTELAIKKRYGHTSQERLEALLNLVKRFTSSRSEYLKNIELLSGLMFVEPMAIFEKIRLQYCFQDRDDEWKAKYDWLSSTYGRDFVDLEKSDKEIIAQAFAVKNKSYAGVGVKTITTDLGWKFLRSKPTPDFAVKIFREKKQSRGDQCVQV